MERSVEDGLLDVAFVLELQLVGLGVEAPSERGVAARILGLPPATRGAANVSSVVAAMVATQLCRRTSLDRFDTLFVEIGRGEPPAIAEEGRWDYSDGSSTWVHGLLSRPLAPGGIEGLEPHPSRTMRQRRSKAA